MTVFEGWLKYGFWLISHCATICVFANFVLPGSHILKRLLIKTQIDDHQAPSYMGSLNVIMNYYSYLLNHMVFQHTLPSVHLLIFHYNLLLQSMFGILLLSLFHIHCCSLTIGSKGTILIKEYFYLLSLYNIYRDMYLWSIGYFSLECLLG